ncbi:MAG: hypothetical protein ACOCUH_02805 [Bacteriovoracia bacterium]
MFLTELRELIEDSYRVRIQSHVSTYYYIQGYLDGLKKYGVIVLKDWQALNNHNQEIFNHGLNVALERIKKSITSKG